jgi:glycosyltransferase involved in cell wall biosynthesis
MSRAPLITILLPVYNGEAYLREALSSMLNQTEPDFELLLIDDGSTDGSVEMARSFQDERIRITGGVTNQGLSARLNEGLDQARGRFVARMDADDIAHPERLRIQTRFLASRPEIGICGTWYKIFGQGRPEAEARLPQDHHRIAARTLFDSPFGHPTVMFNLAHLNRKRLRYPATSPHAEDFAFWAQAHRHVQMANVPEFLLSYRLHNGGVCTRHGAIQEASSNFVREYGLIMMGVPFSEAERKLHHRISLGCRLADRDEVDQALAWLRRLRQSAGRWGKRARGLRRECVARAKGVERNFFEVRGFNG